MATVDASHRERMFCSQLGNTKQFRNWIRECNLDKMFNGKLFSLVADDEKYRQVMIDYYENRMKETKKKLKQEEMILKKLKEK